MSAAANRASRFGSASAVIADYVGDDGLLSDSAFVTHDPLRTFASLRKPRPRVPLTKK